jgi:hypothetical protein
MTTKPRHRWSFTLRTLFVLLTVLCVWMGYTLNVRARRAETRRWMQERGFCKMSYEKMDALWQGGAVGGFVCEWKRRPMPFACG